MNANTTTMCAKCGLPLRFGAQAIVLRYGKLRHLSCPAISPERQSKPFNTATRVARK